MTPLRGKHIRNFVVVVGVGIPLLLSVSRCAAGTLDSIRCYVWDFAVRNGGKSELTRQLTVEFEEKLTQKKLCKVLERRNYARLIAQKDNEKAVLRLEGISTTSLDTLKANNANAVVFGEVYDDIQSGEYKITVTLENFDNSKSVWSVPIRHGLINDAASREKAMEELVGKIAEDSRAAEREANKKDVYEEVSRTLNEFVLRAKDLKEAFRYLPDLAYGDRRIAQNLDSVVFRYDRIVEYLKINRDTFVQEVSTNWKEGEIQGTFRGLLDYALLDIHQSEILVFNDVNARINAILRGAIKDKDEVNATKVNIKTTVEGRVAALNTKLPVLERRTVDFLDMLKP